MIHKLSRLFTILLFSIFSIQQGHANCLSRYREETNKLSVANRELEWIQIGVATLCVGLIVVPGVIIADQIYVTSIRKVKRVIEGAYIFMGQHAALSKFHKKDHEFYIKHFQNAYKKATAKGMNLTPEQYAAMIIQADIDDSLCRKDESHNEHLVQYQEFLNRSAVGNLSQPVVGDITSAKIDNCK